MAGCVFSKISVPGFVLSDEPANEKVTVLFQGPHAYISPHNYQDPGVPTSNYAVVELSGRAKILQTPGQAQSIVDRLTYEHEKTTESPWQPDYPQKMLSAIVGFEILVDEIKATFKPSQNKSERDFQGVLDYLQRSEHTK